MMEFHKLLCRHLGDIASLRERRLARLDVPKNTPPPTPEGEEEDDAEMPQSAETKIDFPKDLMAALEQLGKATGKERDRQKQKIAVTAKRAQELISKNLLGKWETESKGKSTDQTTEKKIQFLENEISKLSAFLMANNIDVKVDKSGNVLVTLKTPDAKSMDYARAPIPNFENMGGPNGRARLLKGLSGSLAEVFGQSYDRLSKPEQEIVARSLGGANPELKAQLYEAIKQYARLSLPIAKELPDHPFVFLDPSRLADTQMLLEEGAKNGLPREQDRLILGLVRQSLDTVAASVRKQMTPEQLKQYEEGQRKLQEHVQENMTEKDRILLNGKQAVNLFRSGRIWEGLLMLIQCYGDFIDALKNKTLGKTQKELGKVNKKPDKPETPVEQKNRVQSELETARSEHKDAVTTRDRIKDGLQKLREEKAKGAEATVIDPKIAKVEAELKTAEAVVVEKKKNLDAAEKKMKDLDKPAASPKEGGAERATENVETGIKKSRHESGLWYLGVVKEGRFVGKNSVNDVSLGDGKTADFIFDAKEGVWHWSKGGVPKELKDALADNSTLDLGANSKIEYTKIAQALGGDMSDMQKSSALYLTGARILSGRGGISNGLEIKDVPVGEQKVDFVFDAKSGVWHWQDATGTQKELKDGLKDLGEPAKKEYAKIQKILEGDAAGEKIKSLDDTGTWYLTHVKGGTVPDGAMDSVDGVSLGGANKVNFRFDYKEGVWHWKDGAGVSKDLNDALKEPTPLNVNEKKEYEKIAKILRGDIADVRKSESIHESGEWFLSVEKGGTTIGNSVTNVSVEGKPMTFTFDAEHGVWRWNKGGVLKELKDAVTDTSENLSVHQKVEYQRMQKILESVPKTESAPVAPAAAPEAAKNILDHLPKGQLLNAGSKEIAPGVSVEFKADGFKLNDIDYVLFGKMKLVKPPVVPAISSPEIRVRLTSVENTGTTLRIASFPGKSDGKPVDLPVAEVEDMIKELTTSGTYSRSEGTNTLIVRKKNA